MPGNIAEHNPNPFDFVPFAEHPILRTPEQFDAMGKLLTGYLELKLKALTPVHVVGYHDAGAAQSHFYRQGGQACIPAASLRGCLRAFLEALTSGWVSQVTPEYEKEQGIRHIGYRAFEEYQNEGRVNKRLSPRAIDTDFEPRVRADHQIDIASYLFGIVIEPPTGEDKESTSLARAAKVWIEDAFFAGELDGRTYWTPDIAGDAFMGGAKPRASNWWYFQPDEIWERHARGLPRPVTEFVGDKYWGRKFYFHQDPLTCVQYYHPDSNNWEYRGRFRRVGLECIKQNETSETFRIYLNRIPTRLAALLTLALLPGANIRHKLGYGKAYGYGSIEFSLHATHFREEDSRTGVPPELADWTAAVQEWYAPGWQTTTIDNSLLDQAALRRLAMILDWRDHAGLVFTYPPYLQLRRGDRDPYGPHNFARVVRFGDFEKAANGIVDVQDGRTAVTETQAAALAVKLAPTKLPLHLRVYQESAEGWARIAGRQP